MKMSSSVGFKNTNLKELQNNSKMEEKINYNYNNNVKIYLFILFRHTKNNILMIYKKIILNLKKGKLILQKNKQC